MFALSSCVCIK